MTVANQPPSYPGNGPFIFVSYSHKDSDRVYPDIAALQVEGISVWYDEGLEPGERWYADVAKHMAMENCRGTVIYASDEFLISDACQKELGYVLDGEKPYLVEVERRRAIVKALALLEADDMLVLCGKGHEDYQEIKGVKYHFDDKEEAKKAMA